ncbi:MAG TPA: NAD(P)/FAD-dependent oxidoreductase [Lapillicoccus sp.]|nr:NAD(P)/FAD-dependent oxidoreductase [Lapillicoccus sp.]
MSDRDVDVLVIGAGLAGIGAAWHLQHERPGTTFAILEARDDLGGTWDLFRFPGVRSDSDMHTLSLPYRPWQGSESRADGARILTYLRESAAAYGIDQRIRFGRKVTRATWSSEDARWTVEVVAGGEPEIWTCSFLYACTGYYDYAAGYTPHFAGVDDFHGEVVHPQLWPSSLGVQGKRVVVVGSGATAVTLVPALADAGAEVTMVQRSPSWVIGVDGGDPIGTRLRDWLPDGLASRISRTQNAAVTIAFYELTRHAPRLAAAYLRHGMRAIVGDKVVAEHFTPRYAPWDQRLCVAPGHDFLRAVADGRVRVITDSIARFVPNGLELGSGQVVDADVVVTATGLNLLSLGGIELVVDGRDVDLGDTFVYRGAMVSGVPNLAVCMGYINASWTLRAEVTHEFVMRVLAYLEEHDAESASPVAPTGMRPHPIMELSAGYVLRGQDRFPKQGDREPWTIRQNWFVDRRAVRRARIDEDMTFVATQPRALKRAS